MKNQVVEETDSEWKSQKAEKGKPYEDPTVLDYFQGRRVGVNWHKQSAFWKVTVSVSNRKIP